MGTRNEIQAFKTPAPGQYNSSSTLVKPRQPVFQYRQGSRLLVNSDGKGGDSPAPGKYE